MKLFIASESPIPIVPLVVACLTDWGAAYSLVPLAEFGILKPGKSESKAKVDPSPLPIDYWLTLLWFLEAF